MQRLLILALFLCFFTSRSLAQNATLRGGDLLEMRLSGMPQEYSADFAQNYTIGQDGTINVPLIGEVRAVGLTPNQLERAIQKKLVEEKIFTRPTVIINPAQVSRFVTVSGGVRQPQRLQWAVDMTLLAAVGNCGGLSDFSSGKGIRIVRNREVVGTYNYKDIQKDPTRDPKLLPADQILVPGE